MAMATQPPDTRGHVSEGWLERKERVSGLNRFQLKYFTFRNITKTSHQVNALLGTNASPGALGKACASEDP